MNRLAQWINDRRWAANARRARAWRRRLLFSQRQAFDNALRPIVGGAIIAYPDALYHVTDDDLIRAMEAASLSGGHGETAA